ncbi:hypothetical protein DXG01_010935 [Tephrocybe rancida]|nr:hypothetical protein DXG01_010935 [Tephrocybe rancida]
MPDLCTVRPIKAGEEIFISYVQESIPMAKRQERLLFAYRFKCACSACTDPSSDALLATLKNTESENHNSAEAALRDSLKWLKVIEEAKWEHLEVYFVHLMRVTVMSLQLSRSTPARKYYYDGLHTKYLPLCEAWHLTRHAKSFKERLGLPAYA